MIPGFGRTNCGSSLPAGLSLDGGTGNITGTPMTLGLYEVEATVTEGAASASETDEPYQVQVATRQGGRFAKGVSGPSTFGIQERETLGREGVL